MSKLSELQVAVDGLLGDVTALRAENAALKQQAAATGDDDGLAALTLKVTEARKLPPVVPDTPADTPEDPIIPASP